MAAKKKNWLLYGANGYSGELIARKAVERGQKPILAGRSESKIRPLAEELGLPYRIFSLGNPKEVQAQILDCFLVLHCAGPFIETALPMAEVCIEAGVHYLDITGEISVYETLHSLSSKALAKKVMLLPGVGFDVVPTDCLAVMLKEKLPKAHSLELGFSGFTDISRGTLKSMLAQLPHGSRVRRNGKIETIPQLSLKKVVEISGKYAEFFAIPWGDVFTSFISTGIPNITVYSSLPEFQTKILKLLQPTALFLKNSLILKGMQKLVELTVRGPNEEKRKKGAALLWGEAWTEANSKKVSIRMRCSEAYEFTVESALAAVAKVEKGKFQAGFTTPGKVFGSKFVLEIPGTKILP
ncbi:saccharopine dehydrogenase domain protein [Leptospira weilii str. 2006001853]|uniref:Saccharopine dehydrogenase domain protein n=4 Tax=Leptospira weilii TaxID=28184 RepID=A0A828Z7Z7_9LEPT|nr:saccharopine dehydrogenase NADP-binding domain-containing protein [Leptospira weilii]EMM71343.1 saccharopine dehydrogenase domain protein [Leptospira weilii str. 2006001855]EMY14031.1 saccharopine dehydrogenase domain protein [Leptospira weilii str. Ecochallenge]EKR65537.1 saccharopine dehydrogenase domain protein [Leptospira weilii str. 2006001853]EMN43988.1 saccharopine dehydrogenase domain protein [Leptospira weilii str. LNT 1234]EMN88422.1 saccharopine dehydrogenase domain protein [Lept